MRVSSIPEHKISRFSFHAGVQLIKSSGGNPKLVGYLLPFFLVEGDADNDLDLF